MQIRKNAKCLSAKYTEIDKSKRNIFYPCDTKFTEGKSETVVYKQILCPKLLSKILLSYGFVTVTSDIMPEYAKNRSMFAILAKKE